MKNDVEKEELHIPVYDYSNGLIHFITIIGRECCQPMTEEIARMLREPVLYEYQMQALHNYLTGHEKTIVYPTYCSMVERRFAITQAMADHIGANVPPRLYLFHNPSKQRDFLTMSKRDFCFMHPDVDTQRYQKAKDDYERWKRMCKVWGDHHIV